ncbi:MAG TPA: acyltransferase [Polyangiaceae bacterium]|nr:acyltransferase [Polyangiaceae bacterium]
MTSLIHPTAHVDPSAVVDDGANVGAATRIWQFCHVMSGARIGDGCTLGQGCFVGGGAVIGNRVKLQNNVSVFDGVLLGDDVFCGPSVVFTNVKNPRAAVSRRGEYRTTRVEHGATIGANATILPGVVIGPFAFVGAGATVTRDVTAFALVVGTPAKRVGWMSAHGERLRFDDDRRAVCPATGRVYRLSSDGAAVQEEPRSDS